LATSLLPGKASDPCAKQAVHHSAMQVQTDALDALQGGATSEKRG